VKQISLIQLTIKKPFSFPLYPMYAFALPKGSRSSEICVKIKKNLKKSSLTLSIAP